MRAALGPVPLADAEQDERFMRLALALGRRHLGGTWPNPSVGAVVVRDGRILGQGVTQPGGVPHAEPTALRAAGEAGRGGTLYVSLEPCSHHGRSPPCVDAVLAAGIDRVVTALEDPDPRVSGRGHDHLRRQGVRVTTGVLASEAGLAHRGHILRVSQGRPAVTLKLARTPDGYAARASGSRLMITGPEAAGRVHLMRARHDAVMVGVGTVLADDPLLNVRLPGLGDVSPVAIVVDTGLRTPPTARLLASSSRRAPWLVTAEDASADREERLRGVGAEVIRVPRADGSGSISMPVALRMLAERGLTRIFCEGGPSLADALARDDLIDEIVLLTGAIPLGEPGLPALGHELQRALATRFRPVSSGRAGPDRVEAFERTD